MVIYGIADTATEVREATINTETTLNSWRTDMSETVSKVREITATTEIAVSP